jgi:hypothetical protein
VFRLKGQAFRIAVSASSPPLLKQVFPEFCAEQRAPLILQAFDVGIFQGLHVEPDGLNADRCDWREFPVPVEPGGYIIDPALK